MSDPGRRWLRKVRPVAGSARRPGRGTVDRMIEVNRLTKRYGPTTAVDGLSFTVRPGHVTGFLGPNGAGKSTTLRLILGLDAPTAGTATIDGRPFRGRRRGLRDAGALLDATAVPAGRSAAAHLAALARSNGLPASRVAAVLEQVGLAAVAGKRVGDFSLGMKQRLGIAAALLGDPGVLIFDEPVNGLDPEGIRWVRGLFRGLAAEGRTVLVSSHLMSEMEHTADHLIVIGRGQLIADTPVAAFVERGARSHVALRTPSPAALTVALATAGGSVTPGPDGLLEVTGLTAAEVGDLALAAGLALHELAPRRASLEDAFMELTADSVDYLAGELS
jgi:ABC-2 type transport system ATP-binding protein